LSRELSLDRPLAHPSLPELELAAQAVQRWALLQHANMADLTVGTTADPADMRQLLDLPPPEHALPFADILTRFDEQVAHHALRLNHPRFLAFVPGAPSFPSILGDWLASAGNFFCGVWLEGAGPTQVELTVLNWFKNWIGYPGTADGLLTSGGSEANLTALVVARERLAFADRARSVLYVSEQRHWSVDRAARIIGLHPDQLRPIPAGSDLRTHPPQLMREIAADRTAGRLPWAFIANAGATNTGSVDPLEALAGVCQRERVWLHVDAAYGWAAVLCDEGKRQLAGIELADSITLDPHKWLAQTFEAGGLLVREGQRLTETFALRPDYLQDSAPEHGEVNVADRGVALTRRFRALKIWLSVQMLGVGWFRDLVERGLRLAEYAELKLKEAGFQIVHPRQLSIVCFRALPADHTDEQIDELNHRLVDDLLQSGEAFLSSTRLYGRVALRMCFINWRTTTGDVDRIVELLHSYARDS